mgnify:FL=1
MSEPLRQTDPLILDMALHSLVEPVRDAEEKYIRLLADLVEKGSGAVQLTDASASAPGTACSGGRKPIKTPVGRAKKRTVRNLKYPCRRAAIIRCPAAESCISGWFRPVLKKKHRVFIKKT